MFRCVLPLLWILNFCASYFLLSLCLTIVREGENFSYMTKLILISMFCQILLKIKVFSTFLRTVRRLFRSLPCVLCRTNRREKSDLKSGCRIRPDQPDEEDADLAGPPKTILRWIGLPSYCRPPSGKAIKSFHSGDFVKTKTVSNLLLPYRRKYDQLEKLCFDFLDQICRPQLQKKITGGFEFFCIFINRHARWAVFRFFCFHFFYAKLAIVSQLDRFVNFFIFLSSPN